MSTLIDFEEQKGIFTMLLLLDEFERLNLTEIRKRGKLGTTASKNASERLLIMKLVERAPTDNPMEKRLRLSEKGKKIIPLLKEIESILQS